MLFLKPFSEDQGSGVAATFDGLATYTYVNCAVGFLHPQTCTRHKLLSPCFKTIELLEILAKSPLWNPQAKPAALQRNSEQALVFYAADSCSIDLILPFEPEK